MILSNYTYEIKYVKSTGNQADFLSRLPIQDNVGPNINANVNYINYFADFTEKLQQINKTY